MGRGLARDLQEMVNLEEEVVENGKEILKERADLVGNASDCERSSYLRIKGALNLPFRGLFYAQLVGWHWEKTEGRDDAAVEGRGWSGCGKGDVRTRRMGKPVGERSRRGQ